jgi:hypothetical protein
MPETDEAADIQEDQAWAAGLDARHTRIAGRFARAEPRTAPVQPGLVLAWSRWRRRHQARARRAHYQQREQQGWLED